MNAFAISGSRESHEESLFFKVGDFMASRIAFHSFSDEIVVRRWWLAEDRDDETVVPPLFLSLLPS